MVWCGVVWCGMVWCGVVWCGVVLCITVAGIVRLLTSVVGVAIVVLVSDVSCV